MTVIVEVIPSIPNCSTNQSFQLLNLIIQILYLLVFTINNARHILDLLDSLSFNFITIFQSIIENDNCFLENLVIL